MDKWVVGFILIVAVVIIGSFLYLNMEADKMIDRAEDVRDLYEERILEQQKGLDEIEKALEDLEDY